jgi:tripartite-type tricarboxylate transporter receptor subunit TctC
MGCTAWQGLVLSLALGAVALAPPAVAQDNPQHNPQHYPQRTVTFVCPFPAGGGTDILTRMLAAELQDKLKGTVIVENRVGGGTVLAAQTVARSAPDGHTILLAPVTTLAINPSVFKSLPYDPVKDFAPIGLVGAAEFALVANPSLGARTLPELIDMIRKRPGELSFGTSGAGTPHHLFMAMFLRMIDGKAQHVPYRGSGPAVMDVASGQIHFMMVDLAVAMPLIKDGKVIPYGVTSATRVPAMPELPIIAEAGLPGYVGAGWFSVVARSGTPRPVVERINAILTAFVQRPEVMDRMNNTFAIRPLTSTPDELQRHISAEIAKWAQVVKDAGIEPE